MAHQGNLPSREDPSSLPSSACLVSDWVCQIFSGSGPAQFVLMNAQGEMSVGFVLGARDRLLRARLFCARCECGLLVRGAKDRLLRARLFRARGESCSGGRTAYFVRGANAGCFVLRAKDRLLRARLFRARGECWLARARGEGPLTSCAALSCAGRMLVGSCAGRGIAYFVRGSFVRGANVGWLVLGARDRLLRARLFRAQGECWLARARGEGPLSDAAPSGNALGSLFGSLRFRFLDFLLASE